MRSNIYKSKITGNIAVKKDDGWYDTITNKKLMNYEVYKFVSLSKQQ